MLSATTTPEVVKVSVFASGALLLDGRSVTLDGLGQALKSAKERNAVVWYYREAAASDPPPQAAEVIKLIIQNGLPVKLSTKPDFSDSVGPGPGLEQVFVGARKRAGSARDLVIVLPNGRCRAVAAPPPGTVPAQAVKSVESLIPPGVQRNVAVMASTGFASSETAGVAEAGRAIPFFGLLMGLSHIGHAVWIFEGHPAAVAAGCRDADVLIVDSAMLAQLEKGWDKTAQEAMRNPNILVHDRKSFKLIVVRSAGETKGKIEFVG